jgi:coenzyme F420-reducing hydrogenase beta subunit
MYLSSYDRADCCGCGGCQQICPLDCITMTLLDDGFLYPVIDEENCVHCGKCVKVCPIHQSEKPLQDYQLLVCYYGWHKNESTRMKSTSGGTFSAIAELVLENSNSCVYGALYDDNWTVRHWGINSLIGLDRLRQSKYVQSDLGSCYSEIQERLNRHEHVLFCGTPCQVDGLRLFLGKEYEKLLLVDFVCHGVTSPAMFEAYIRYLEKKQGSRVRMFRFRDKVTKGSMSSLGYTTIVFENSRTKSSECNLYLQAYVHGLMQRVSCEKCPYASRYRRSDVTLGDFWGIEDVIPILKDQFHKGISLILSNTEKGRAICGKLSDRMCLVQTELSYAFNGGNAQLEKPVQVNKKKLQLYSDVKRLGVQLALARALGLRNLLLMYYGCCKNWVKGYLSKEVYMWMVFLKRSLRKI